VELIAGLRYDRFKVDFDDRRTTTLATVYPARTAASVRASD
jgi:hypothetical protein